MALARAVADFALASDPECLLERVTSLALVQAGVGPALHIGVEQPVDDEERSIDPSDFAESDDQFVLARIGRELSQQLARRKGTAGQGGSNPQDVWPAPLRYSFIPAGAALSVRGSYSGRRCRSPRPPPDRSQERLISMVRKYLRKRDPIRTLPLWRQASSDTRAVPLTGRTWPPSARPSGSSASPRIASTPTTASPARPTPAPASARPSPPCAGATPWSYPN